MMKTKLYGPLETSVDKYVDYLREELYPSIPASYYGDKRLVAQLKKLQRFIQAGLTDQANQVVARELSMMQREGVEEGWFDFSGKEMKQYIEFAQKRMNWYPDAKLRQELKKKFPEIKPVDIERTIKQVQGLRQNRAP